MRTERTPQITLAFDGATLGSIAELTYFPELGKWEAIEKCDYYYKDLFTNEQMIAFAEHILRLCNQPKEIT